MVELIWNAAGVKSRGLQDYMTNHGMQVTMISMLIDSYHPDSSIILRSGHSNVATLTRYHNLSSLEGFKQQLGLFTKSFNELPLTSADPEPFENVFSNKRAKGRTALM